MDLIRCIECTDGPAPWRSWRCSCIPVWNQRSRNASTVFSGISHPDIGGDHASESCFLTSAKRPTAGRIQREVEDRLAEIAKHHIGLVAPQRLLLLGNAASRAILGMELLAARGQLHAFNHKTAQAGAGDMAGSDTTGVVASFHPRFLIEKPAAKAEAWKDLQMLMRAPKSQGPMSQGAAR